MFAGRSSEMNHDLEALFRAVRDGCSPARWSRGVELSRSGGVFLESRNDDELVFRIAGSRPAGRTLRLFLDDHEWDCGCDSPEPGCEHVAAAVIVWKRAAEAGVQLQSAARVAGRVSYRFERGPGGLALGRVLVTDDGESILERTLAALAQRDPMLHARVVSQADLAVELAMGTYRRGALPPRIVRKLFARVAQCQDVRLAGLPVEVSAEPVRPLVRVEDQHDGFRLVLIDDAAVSETFANGIVLRDGVLRPLDETGLDGRERNELPRGIRFGPDRVAELVTEVIPSLGRRVRLEIVTTRLPQGVKEAPRIRLDAERDGERLSVLATLVYGDPPRARVDAGRLVHLAGAVPIRDERAERALTRRLQRELGLVPGLRADFVGEQAVAFNRRLEHREGVDAAAAALRFFELRPPLRPSFRLRGDDFELSFDCDAVAGTRAGRAETERVIRAWCDGASLVPLTDGGYAPLPIEWLARNGERVADLLAARQPNGALPPACLPDLAALCAELDQPEPPGFTRLGRLVHGFDGLPAATLPADLTASLRPYQRAGVDWLVFLRDAGLGALLADDMGLGKTLQALCAIRGRTLVVSPTSVLHNWADEITRFRPALTVSIYHGPTRALDPAADVTLTTYALLRADADRLCAERWSTVVLDETQAIKNPESQVARAAYRLDADFRVALSGTPVENRLDELWSQFHYTNSGLLGGRSDFQRRYAAPIDAGDATVAGRLRDRIRPFVLRRLKQQVAPELPPRTDLVLYCELDPQERELYDTIRAATLREVVDKLARGAGVLAALEALLRLRQAACHSALIPGQQASDSSKLRTLMEALDNVVAEGHKAIVFSQWTSLLDLTEPALRRAGIDHLRLDGSTRDRGSVVRGFQDLAGPPLLLVSLKAGGTGLNLTAADHVFLLDPWWNPAVEDQAADRAHRIGQLVPVFVYRLVAEQTVEERILDLQRRKRAVADAALGQADAAAAITREELMELLG
ncbi:MAG TPA: DEAD/DEAH box helicase [Candidatus Polarisedimenticolaceae bacterium]|nr:DEAD/DEAH box helicase [Candidatus Polarisedimenticolaceae bacterium]